MEPKPNLDAIPVLLVGVGLAVGLSIAALIVSVSRLRSVVVPRGPRWPKARWIILPVFGVAALGIALVWLLIDARYRATALVRISPVSPMIVPRVSESDIPLYLAFVNTEVSASRPLNIRLHPTSTVAAAVILQRSNRRSPRMLEWLPLPPMAGDSFLPVTQSGDTVTGMLERKIIHRFDAVDELGKVYPLEVWEFSAPAPSRGNPSGKAVDRKIFTAAKEAVEMVAKRKYRIKTTGTLLKSTDPPVM